MEAFAIPPSKSCAVVEMLASALPLCIRYNISFGSNDVLRFQLTCTRVGQFYLYGRVRDFKPVVKFVAKSLKKLIARMALRHDKMTRKRGFGRAHSPYVQIVDSFDARQATEKLCHLFGVDFSRNSV